MSAGMIGQHVPFKRAPFAWMEWTNSHNLSSPFPFEHVGKVHL